jgi:hypothetical protein
MSTKETLFHGGQEEDQGEAVADSEVLVVEVLEVADLAEVGNI